MKKIDRQGVHDFLDMMIAGQTPAEQVAILKDIMVDEFCFNGIADDKNLSTLEAEIHEAIKKDPGQKIMLIKKVREATGLGLKEAKDFVESVTPGHPSYGIRPAGIGTSTVSNLQKTMITDHFLAQLGARLNKIAKDYGKPEAF